MQLTEKYRPRAWNEVVGQDKAVRVVDRRRERDGGLGGKAFFISGASGTGKTTIGYLIAAEVSGMGTEELDAGDLTPAKIKEAEKRAAGRCIDGKGFAFIVNEVHGLRKDAVRQLLVTIERLPQHVVWIFTTTSEGQDSLFDDNIDAHPLLSRCVELPLARRGLADVFAQRALEIARAEDLDGQPLAKYKRLLQDCRNNLRMALQRIENGYMMEG